MEYTPSDKILIASGFAKPNKYTSEGEAGIENTFSIKDIADKTGFSQDTIRYYEKIGLLPSPRRSINGQREYTEGDLKRFIFVSQLKRTDMPLREIERYIDFYTANNYEGCYNVLNDHKSHIQTKLADMVATLDIMNYKLDHFQQIIYSTKKGDHISE